MNSLAELGWQLAWFDRLTRAVVGIGLILLASLGGWSTWVTVLVAATGGILAFEAAISYCPLARIWPWNR
jgi:hypothetical protein